MFKKYAYNVLQDLSNECLLKSLASKDLEVSEVYQNISRKIDWMVRKLGVEESGRKLTKKHG
jgi:hypothetical protein